MKVLFVDGIPTLCPENEVQVKTETVRKSKKVKHHLSQNQSMTLRQRHALKNYFNGMTKTAAGEAAGYKAPIQAVNTALRLASGNEEFIKAMEAEGVDNRKLAEVLSEGLEATHPFKPDEKDFHAIHKFWQDAVKIQGAFPATKIEQEIKKKSIHIHLTKDDLAAAEKYERLKPEDVEVVDG